MTKYIIIKLSIGSDFDLIQYFLNEINIFHVLCLGIVETGAPTILIINITTFIGPGIDTHSPINQGLCWSLSQLSVGESRGILQYTESTQRFCHSSVFLFFELCLLCVWWFATSSIIIYLLPYLTVCFVFHCD